MFSQAERFFLDKIHTGLRIISEERYNPQYDNLLSQSEEELLGTDISDPEVMQSLQRDECKEVATRCARALRAAYEYERNRIKMKMKVQGLREGYADTDKLKEWWRQYEEILSDSKKFISGVVQIFYVEQGKVEQLEKKQARENMKKAIGCSSSAVIFITILIIASVAYAYMMSP